MKMIVNLALVASCFAILPGCASTTLLEAAQKNDFDRVQSLIKNGTYVDSDDYNVLPALAASKVYGTTPLMAASKRGYTELVQFLIEKGANVNSVNSVGMTPLTLAATYGQAGIAKTLIERGANVNYGRSPNDQLIGVNANGQYSFQITGESPLTLATFGGHSDAAKLLIETGADVNHQNSIGRTPLINSSANGLTEIAKLLIDKGANLNLADGNGQTAIMMAAGVGDAEIAKMLVDKGADVNIVAKTGTTALILAASKGYTDIVQLLIVKGADISVRGEDGKSAADWAKENKNVVTYKLLEKLQLR